jgi:integrase
MLTAKNVLTLKAPDRGQRDYADDVVPGLAVRVSAYGGRVYAIRYYAGGRRRRMALGAVGVLSLADARELARERLRAVAGGQDPQAEKAAQRQRTDTFGDLVHRFLNENGPKLRPATREAWERYVRKEIIPAFGERRPEDITRGDVRGFVNRIKARAPIAANRAFEVLRRIYSWAIGEEILTASPCIGLGRKRKPVLLTEEAPRQVVYSSDEIRAIFAAVEGGQLEDLVPLIFHTGTRSDETRAATWSQIDRDKRLWTIPPEHSKSGLVHPVPLSSGAMRILDRIAARQVAAPSEFLFPADSRTGHMDKPNKSTARLQEVPGVPAEFRLHDVRRTVSTGLSEMGTRDETVEAVLGHTPPGLRRTYIVTYVYSKVPETRAALEAWSSRLEALLSGEERRANVVPFSA